MERIGQRRQMAESRVVAIDLPDGDFDPADFVRFVELDSFADDWKRLGLGDDDLTALQALVMAAPGRPPVIAGTGGLRKLRFAPVAWGTGKSGAARVCYVYLEEWSAVLLVVAYAKNERDNLTNEERNVISRLIASIESQFANRIIR